jgi:hypothetical protein
MPQLTIYLDQESDEAVRQAAQREQLSQSKWARIALLKAASEEHQWPPNYQNLFGSITDPSFAPPQDSQANLDHPADFGA